MTFTPVIIGVADIKSQSKELREDGRDEPASLISQAIERAIHDTGLDFSLAEKLQNAIDSIDVVRPWAWPYPDLASLLAERLGISPAHRYVSPHGGNQPAKLLDEACRRIAAGQTKVAVVTGGEALDSLARYIKAQKFPPPGWTAVESDDLIMNALRPPSEKGLKGVHGVGVPIQVYPLYENGFRAHHKQSFQQNHEDSAQMYAEFAEVSKNNPISWNFERSESKESIGTVSAKNRMICSPYPLLMNAFNTINLAGACIVTSTEFAEQLGVEKSKFVYPLGGAGTAESEEFYMRTNFYSSPAISRSIDTALQVSGLKQEQIDMYDFYSCFPIVPKLACKHLSMPTSQPPKPITLLGGLTSFGGAGNNYSMHAITTMSRLLRAGKNGVKTGLILANGGILSYQHVICLSSSTRSTPYPAKVPLPEYVDDVPVPEFIQQVPEQGDDCVIETYTVEYGRSGSPKRGHIVGRLASNGHRFIANHADQETLKKLAATSEEIIGRKGWVSRDKETEGRNLFSFEKTGKL